MSYIMDKLEEKAYLGHFYEESCPVWDRDVRKLFDEGFTLKLIRRDPFFEKTETFIPGDNVSSKKIARIKGKSIYLVSWEDCIVKLPANWILEEILATSAQSGYPLKWGQILWLRAKDFQRAAEAKAEAEAEAKAGA
jgi:hypothetical protein